VQIQALLAGGARGGDKEGEGGSREVERGGEIEVAKPQIFDGMSSKVAGFIMVCKLYIRMRIREEPVEGQVQWILSYVHRETADVWKENIIEKLEAGELEYKTVEEFLISLKKEFGGGEEESVKAAELKKLEQGGKTMEELIQKFKRAARGSGYKGRPLVKEFRREMNGGIRRKLMESENPPGSIEQLYKKATVLDQNWRESRREEKRLRGKREMGGGVPKQEQQQNIP